MSDEHTEACTGMCKLTVEEREWVHTARKYIDSKHLPALGKFLKAFEDTSYAIGRAVLMAIIVGGASLLLWWIIVKVR